MIPLCSLFSILAFLSSGQWFQLSTQSFYGPTYLVLFLNNLRIDRILATIRDHPVNITVRGDYLEKLRFKRHFLELNGDAPLELLISPLNLLQRNVTLFLTQADETVFF